MILEDDMFMQITAYAHTSQGGRPVNEDTVKVWAGEKPVSYTHLRAHETF